MKLTTETKPVPKASAAAVDDQAHVVHHMSVLSDVASRGPLMIVRGSGLRVYSSEGREYLDALAGLFNVNVGYGRDELAEVAHSSMQRLGFATLFFGRGSEPAARLARKLAEITPPQIQRFFFTHGGSDANESAIKFARYYHALLGKPERFKIIGRHQSYHGMTMGATSATGQPTFWKDIGPLLPGFVHVQQPLDDASAALEELEECILSEGPETIAAFMAEPISMHVGVGVPPDDYWQSVQEICARYDILLISDEVITGFGRTGKMFAAEHWGIEADLLVMSKGITSGYLPLGAVGMTEAIYAVMAESSAMLRHGFTAGGHPVCCDVALRNIEIIEREDLVENSRIQGDLLRRDLDELAEASPIVKRIRSLGLLVGVELESEPSAPLTSQELGAFVCDDLTDNGILLRNYGKTIALGPSLTASADEIRAITAGLAASLSRCAPMGQNPD